MRVFKSVSELSVCDLAGVFEFCLAPGHSCSLEAVLHSTFKLYMVSLQKGFP